MSSTRTNPVRNAPVAIVGRSREHRLITAALQAGRDILLEGPPGTSKSTMLRSISADWGVGFHLVEGNAELTSSRLVGHHNPARVLAEDYTEANFVAGPLVQAMQSGSFLYVEELNRAPEDSLNMLLAAMAERALEVPRYGTVTALPGFRLLASMNPFDNIGTGRISDSVYDRWCRLVVDYQGEEEERLIVEGAVADAAPDLVADAVAITRATRSHDDLRRGSSIRGAIDLAAIAVSLNDGQKPDPDHRNVHDAAQLALSARISLDETSQCTAEQVITEIWETHYFCTPGDESRGLHS